MTFTAEQKQQLLKFSRQVLLETIKHTPPEDKTCPDPSFEEKAGLFVSLHNSEHLRGCIGFIEPIASIWEAIEENTVSAATRDYRFSPVTPEEVDNLNIEISILTPPVKCQLENIKKGSGVIIEQGRHKATYLPQVWSDLPDKTEFLSSLCQKAGLDSDCFLNPKTNFYIYQAIVFNE